MTIESAPAGNYRPVPTSIDLPAMEREVLDFWEANDTFAASLAATADGAPWTFYEGPPTANGMPGTHHIEARVFKDVFPRFKTMQGFRVDRKAGWDCHGLPVELAVEKELGFNGKPDIEAYGVEPFNAKCRESVSRHVGEFSELTRRMGYWVNLDEAYWTMSPDYVESVWWALKQIHSKGLLVEDYRVAPYCPRCGTTLSDHELAQGYEDVSDPSVYVRFPLTSGPLAGKASLLVWTTTPWTLVSNTAAAVHPEVTYVVATQDVPGGESLVLAEALAEKVLGEGWLLGQTFVGKQMEYWTYSRPLDLIDFPDVVGGTHYILMADYVTTEDGTGAVHEAPAFGEVDMEVCRAYGLPLVNPVRPDGTFEEGLDLVGGLFFKDADQVVIDDLTARGVMFKVEYHTHSYPHCWRCHTALLYYAQPSWYIRTTAIKDALLRENAGTNWYPEHIKWGRYGDWLNNNIDWALSRSRYWGTPLPIWRCEDGHQTCVGSRAELSELVGTDLAGLDPHRPFVDEVSFACPTCRKPAHRVPEVIDAWFDSGAMPFAQWGYPWAEGSAEVFATAYPADFICEAIDQTRGWFYSLMAIGTLVFDESSYQNVLCLGHILAEDGRKMSKHLGNILEPIPLMDAHGADAVRWFMAAGGSPWSSRRVGHQTITETVRKVLMTYLNTVSFQTIYAGANDWTPTLRQAQGTEIKIPEPINQIPEPINQIPEPVEGSAHVLDRWLVSARNVLVREVTDSLEDFDTQRAGTLLADFVDNLSNWYVRRSRRRFWEGQPGALQTLHDTLHVVTRLMAPLAPFVTERVWQDLFVTTDPTEVASVHLSSWPQVDVAMIDEDLDAAMGLTRRLVELGRSARAEAKMKTRQPLARALVPSAAYASLDAELLAEVAEELNVWAVESFASAGDLVDYSAKGNFRSLGRRFGKQTPLVAAAIAEADAAALAAAIRAEGTAIVTVAELGEVSVDAEEVLLTERPREGWSVVNEQGETVALDLVLTPELMQAGLARDFIRAVQEARKQSGFAVSDRIRLTWAATVEATGTALRAQASQIAEEVLAVEMSEAAATADWFVDTDLGFAFTVTRAAG
ncbi:isoleucine--tRNA ligase [Propionicimonas sp.]|uniref:isoleucine--tRNA ligase n=1 Tax=Propionicimonas sp. TaxID=1955623 RepID=UPI0017B5F5B9|nr:isoleucine--tRNA ligase [Propionicimonas sp.]MBU3986200.1 isoleucine--tRNA ligase [Actinomycetota bacterium]MBA3019946.1 isoleucine--tRNA ligase [Propionicimonas sp.]MBU4007769.1 isoleucine--tRNA ligase [Actinomycetota bacterium]MBU4064027.1 isoleucine--tRNA ligase [Actinomycetota bacterium]MBU4093035.1 isoleucine--tRNA ligase [Actinomycetota bacterium]